MRAPLKPRSAGAITAGWPQARSRAADPPLCPDRVVELAKARDEGPHGVTALRRKVDPYQPNGTGLGWLLLPHERAVEIWREGRRGWPSGWRMPGHPHIAGSCSA